MAILILKLEVKGFEKIKEGKVYFGVQSTMLLRLPKVPG
jgi:hypothetical protein